MKNILKFPILLAFAFTFLSLRAATVTISVSNFQFSPSSVTINCGDTLIWNWVQGSHTVTSTNIPTNAVAFDTVMNSDFSSFMYVPSLPGTYNYQCTPHAGMGMTASFTVSCPNSVNGISKTENTIYPNPFFDRISIQTREESQIELFSMEGKILKTGTGNSEIQTGDLNPGVYIIRITSKGNLPETRKVIKRN